MLPGNIERWKYFVKLKWVLDRTKRRAFAVLSSSDSYSLCRFSKAGNTAEIWTLWPSERLTNSRLLKSWAGGMEVISFNYSVFVSYLTNVYGVGDWSDQIKKFQITLTRKSPVGWGLGRPHDLNMESRGQQATSGTGLLLSILGSGESKQARNASDWIMWGVVVMPLTHLMQWPATILSQHKESRNVYNSF